MPQEAILVVGGGLPSFLGHLVRIMYKRFREQTLGLAFLERVADVVQQKHSGYIPRSP
jgi:hypothetical protein